MIKKYTENGFPWFIVLFKWHSLASFPNWDFGILWNNADADRNISDTKTKDNENEIRDNQIERQKVMKRLLKSTSKGSPEILNLSKK